jgi:hypothetical protein
MTQVIYLAGPYSATTINQTYENIQKARQKAIELWTQGNAVICPHLNSYMMDGVVPYEQFLNGYLEILKQCDAVYMMSGWETSKGSKRENEFAKENNIPVIYDRP